jgi:N-acetylmuramoyl-L-alanine amidase
MKKIILSFLFILCFISLFANVKINYKDSKNKEVLSTVIIDSLEYFNIYELNKAFNAYIFEDVLDQRVHVNLYNTQFIVLLETPYVAHQNNFYNMIYPAVIENKKIFLPITFFEKAIYKTIPNDISLQKDHSILAKIPIDHSIKRIVLDPGHGGKDPGAIGYSKKNYEKTIVLQVAKKLKKMLESNLDVEVLLTRSKDEFVSLQKRTRFANQKQADLFISIHCNASRNKKSRGTEVYFLSTARTNDARAVEALENSVVFEYEGGQDAVQQYDGLAFILIDMAQSEHLDESSHLALKLQDYLVSRGNTEDRGVKQAGFYVLKGAYMPAVLLELGFITNKEEEKLLINSSFQERLCAAIYEGVKSFKLKYDRMQ